MPAIPAPIPTERAMLRVAVSELLEGPRFLGDFSKPIANALCSRGLAEYLRRPDGRWVLKITDAGRALLKAVA